jgi:dTDP-4-amino-4,6-dideoxy-D-galactose acyltransferase
MGDTVQALAWDTVFFGFGICRIESSGPAGLVAAVDEARQRGMKLAYWFTGPSDSAATESAKAVNAKLVDRKVTYKIDVANVAPTALDPRHEQAMEVTPQLRSLAIQSGHYSRYKVDSGFPPGAFEKMYNIWLERSVSGAIAKEVLVFKDDGQELGFVTLGIKNGRANIGLIAVDSASRSKGIGAHLVNAAFSKAKEWGVEQIDVVTQVDNTGACRFYERCGFAPEKVEHIYHIWID